MIAMPPEEARLSIETVNGMDADAFAAAFGDIYEHSRWVAEAAFASVPFESLSALHAAMQDAVEAAPKTARLDLIRAHPDLAGKAALAGELTADSSAEQASAGLDRLSPEQMARFQALNAAYVERFGFPFVMAVRDADAARIIAGFEGRLENDRAGEIRRALAEIGKIAWMRLLAAVIPVPTGRLTTHVLCTATGRPADGMPVALYRLDSDGGRTLLGRFITNPDGRLDAPALAGADLEAGTYELVFEAGVYFARAGVATDAPAFLDRVPVRFSIANPERHYHVPLLVSPWAYSTYRGS